MMERGPDIVVLTGRLGSGKTTLLRDVLATDEAAGTAIMVNEVGAIGLDEALLREAGREVAGAPPMMTLSNGCVCCQMGGDLAAAIETLLAAERPPGAPPLVRIVLETSGLSKPGPILRQLTVLAPHRMRVLVLATFDATRGLDTDETEEAAPQWAGAHRIVVTKTDMIATGRLAACGREIAALNPLAEAVVEPDRASAVRLAFAAPSGMVLPNLALPDMMAPRHPRLRTFLLRPTEPFGYDDLAAWLDNLAGLAGERLLRLKGVLAIRDGPPMLVQSVGTLFAAPRPAPQAWAETGSFLVVIARDLSADDIRAAPPDLGFRVTDDEPSRPFARQQAAARPRAQAV